MSPKITATIDHMTEHEFDQIARAGAGSRYEVVLDYTDGDHHELEAHFRLVELTATRLPSPDEVLPETIDVGGASGPVMRMKLHRQPELDLGRLAELLAHLTDLSNISPHVLGIPNGDDGLEARIRRYLVGWEPEDTTMTMTEVRTMGKHGDGKPADSKGGGSKGGGSHEKGGKGK